MLLTDAPFWKQAPFTRLLLPLCAGILLQWYYPIAPQLIIILVSTLLVIFTLLLLLKEVHLFRMKWIAGICLMLMVSGLGALLLQYRNIQHQFSWFGHGYTDSSSLMVVLNEVPIAKNKTYKIEADVMALNESGHTRKASGKIILYIKKEDFQASLLQAGGVLIITKTVQPVTNSGNPGAFDYKRYCLFQGVTHQVFLSAGDFIVTGMERQSVFRKRLIQLQQSILAIVKKFISGKDNYGIAEALLIGYREDIDRDLVQEYANTGVIHVIAISGMHLAMIYGVLLMLLKPLDKGNKRRLVKSFIILSVLWGFSFVSGAGPSILRSAVMFSFIVIGQNLNRPVSVYHSLSASAFFLLCNNPFLLWDVGFQLSYTAVLSIVIFHPSVSNWLYSSNIVLNNIWKLMAVTIAAQVLTTPLSMYHFHQLPNLFLISNLVIVPLSGIILYGEILLCLLSSVAVIARFLGDLLTYLIEKMNGFNHWLSNMPFAVTNGIDISVPEVILLYGVIIFSFVWQLQKKTTWLLWGLLCILALSVVFQYNAYAKNRRTGILVYNVPQHSAVDFFADGHFKFVGDSVLRRDDFMRNFHVTPARTAYQHSPREQLPRLWYRHPYALLDTLRIVFIDGSRELVSVPEPMVIDVAVISGGYKKSVTLIRESFNAKYFVFDGSCPRWKTQRWKNECDSLHLRRHSVQEQGAFELEFNSSRLNRP